MAKSKNKKRSKHFTYAQIEGLFLALGSVVDQMDSWQTDEVTDHIKLLREHAIMLRARCEEMCSRGQDKYLLTLTAPEAMAMYQLWGIGWALSPYAGVAVQKLVADIDHQHVSGTWHL